MPKNQLTVVLSQGQSRNPEKRSIEDGVAQAAAKLTNTTVLVVPHLYDLSPKGETLQSLRNIDGPIVVFSWLFERAAHWVLDRNAVRGQVGNVQLIDESDEEDDDEDEDEEKEEEEKEDRVASQFPRPDRDIFCVDLRVRNTVEPFVDELARIHAECMSRFVDSATEVARESVARFEHPTNSTALAADGSGRLSLDLSKLGTADTAEQVITIAEHPNRRWYPVIDFSRCTNCMECIDFCLFGVYGVDGAETILVEQPDNCRKGCPACSRVCPANAIMFPQHKTPAIAGADVDAGSMKIDLSKLFGAPDRDEDAVAAAARERDEQLILAGRNAVGMVGLASTTAAPSTSTLTMPEPEAVNATNAHAKPKDDLDQLLDQLDALDL